MNRLQRALAWMVLALAAGLVSYASAADERSARSAQWADAAARQAQEAQRQQREARLRWEYERRQSAAHARMPNTLYASTPSNQAHEDLACPVPVDDDARRLYRKALTGQGSSAGVLNAPDLFRSSSSSAHGSNPACGEWPRLLTTPKTGCRTLDILMVGELYPALMTPSPGFSQKKPA